MSLNLILGRSARAALSTLERCQGANTLCVVSPSPRAERRMSSDEMVLVFGYMGHYLKCMTRMETHFYSHNDVWLPAKALTAFLKNAEKVEDFLLNGTRIRGSEEEIAMLGEAILNHPSLRKITFFNIASHRTTSSKGEASLLPILEGASRNANVRHLELRWAAWANHYLGAVVHDQSQVTILNMSGSDTLYGPSGNGINQGFPDLMEGLKTNIRLRELKLTQSPGPIGTGALVAEMLRENEHLKSLSIHLSEFTDCLPIASALEGSNRTLVTLDTRVNDLPPGTAAEAHERRAEEILAVQNAYESALATNGTLRDVRLTSRFRDHSTETMAFYTRMNKANRMDILSDEELTAEEALEFLESNIDDPSTIYFMIRSKISILPLVVQHCSVPRARRAPPKDCDSDSDSDDDLPIKFLASRANAKAKVKSVKRKRTTKNKKGKTSIQARPARTLKRRRRN